MNKKCVELQMDYDSCSGWADNNRMHTEEENHGFPRYSPTGVKDQKDRMMIAEGASVADAERSEARSRLEIKP